MKNVVLHKKEFKWIDYASPAEDEIEKLAEEHQLPLSSFGQNHLSKTMPFLENLKHGTFLVLRIFFDSSQEGKQHSQKATRRLFVYFDEDLVLTLHRMPARFVESFDEGKNECSQPRDVILLLLKLALESYERPLREAFDTIDSFEKVLFDKKEHPSVARIAFAARRRVSLIKHLLMNTMDIVQRLNLKEPKSTAMIEIKETLTHLIFSADEILEDFTSTMHLHLALASQQTNEIMRVLTLFSVVILPLTLIAGIYGMSFEHQPEYKWTLGYPWALGLMTISAVTLFAWFYQRGWIRVNGKKPTMKPRNS